MERDPQVKRPEQLSEPNRACPTGVRWHDVCITRVANGFILHVGCRTFVGTTWEEVSAGLALYWRDPEEAQRKYCGAQ